MNLTTNKVDPLTKLTFSMLDDIQSFSNTTISNMKVTKEDDVYRVTFTYTCPTEIYFIPVTITLTEDELESTDAFEWE